MDRLQELFNKQKELIEKIAPVEEANSPLPSAKNIMDRLAIESNTTKLVLEDRMVQLRLKESAWRLTEELGEVMNAHVMRDENIQEEVIDCLHFMMELSICSNLLIPPDRDMYQNLFEGSIAHPGVDGVHMAVANLIHCLGMTMNLLKNKPWKRTVTELDVPEYHQRLAQTWLAFMDLAQTVGLTPDSMYDGYFAKHQVNVERQNNGY